MPPVTRQAAKARRISEHQNAETSSQAIPRQTAAHKFSQSIWSRIISYCVDKGDEGAFVPQPTLVNVLKVCKAMLILTAPHLYRTPVVQDVGSFFLGAEKSVGARTGETAMSQLRLGYTKLALLRYVHKLTIIPYTITSDRTQPSTRPNRTEKQICIEQKASYKLAVNVLRGLRLIPSDLSSDITPNLRYITIGSCLFANTRAGERIVAKFNENIRPLKSLLVQKCKPKHWCEYADEGGGSIDLRHLPYNNYIDGTLPECVTIHTELMDPVHIVWGTKNRIVLRKEIDVFENMWPKQKERTNALQQRLMAVSQIKPDQGNQRPIHHRNNDTNEEAQSPCAVWVYDKNTEINWPCQSGGKPYRVLNNGEVEEITEMDPEIVYRLNRPLDPTGNLASNPTKDWMQSMNETGPNYDEETIIRILSNSIWSSVPEWLYDDHKDIWDKMDMKTQIEIYGIEKVIPRPKWGDEKYDHAPYGSDNEDGYYDTPSEDEKIKSLHKILEKKWDSLPKDLTYWASYSDNRFSLRYRQYMRKRQRKRIRHLEFEVRNKTDEPCRWYDSTNKYSYTNGPVMKFLLGREYQGCRCCGQGKDDRWVLDKRPIPDRTAVSEFGDSDSDGGNSDDTRNEISGEGSTDNEDSESENSDSEDSESEDSDSQNSSEEMFEEEE